jgi:hypothetical protein
MMIHPKRARKAKRKGIRLNVQLIELKMKKLVDENEATKFLKMIKHGKYSMVC